ncbi:MAG TPA: hypothetical protein VMU42_05295, partial [Candidatus Sulfotelmatobacter sp.]|nr:hypothetical protein [Candidatus Sulfotelmatobacter sp.]
MTIGNIRTTTAGAALAALLAVMMLAIPAWSAAPTAPIFPPGSHIGLVPPPGMVASSAFPGFVDPTKNAGIVISSLPGNAYADMEKTLTADALKQRGITLEKRETLQLNIGKGDLVIGTQLGPDKMPYRKW